MSAKFLNELKNEIKAESKIFTISFSFYFVAIVIAESYYYSMLRLYSLKSLLLKNFHNPYFLIALAILPIALKFYHDTRNESLDKILTCLLYAYGLGKFTAYTQYLHHIMTPQIIIRTTIPIITCCILIYCYTAFFHTTNEIKYTLGTLLASLVIYLQNLDLYMFFPSIFSQPFYQFIAPFGGLSLNLIILRLCVSD